MRAAFLSSLANLGILIGGFTGGCLAGPIAIGGALLAGGFSFVPVSIL
jgi:hypothetical protein